MSRPDPETRAAREVMDRAIARLGILEYLFLALAAGAALLAGALTGWLLGQALGWPFRTTWTVSSLMYFVVPGGVAWVRARRADAGERARTIDDDGDTRAI
jgi:uncharacterized membrane protein